MTNRPPNPSVRRAARALALTPALVVLSSTGAAFAAPPEAWPNPPQVSALYVILVLGAIPLGLFVLITLLVYVPSMSRGAQHQPGEAWRGEAEWFGGPRGGLDAADKAPPAVGDGRAEPTRGGTSGHW